MFNNSMALGVEPVINPLIKKEVNMKKMKAYLCHWCKRIYIGKRPLLCECKSNAFLKEHETTEDEISQLKEENTNIIIIYNTH